MRYDRFIGPVEAAPAGEVRAAELPGIAPPALSAASVPAPSGWQPRRLGWLASASVALACISLWMPFAKRTGSASAAVTLRPSVAVLGFKNLNAKPEQAWLSTALAEMLATEITVGDGVRTIPGESVARTKVDMGLREEDSYSADTLSKIRKNLGADYVLVGSYLNASGASAGRVRLDLRLQDARSGETVATFPETGGEDDLPGLAMQAGLALRQKLAGGSPSHNSRPVQYPCIQSGSFTKRRCTNI